MNQKGCQVLGWRWLRGEKFIPVCPREQGPGASVESRTRAQINPASSHGRLPKCSGKSCPSGTEAAEGAAGDKTPSSMRVSSPGSRKLSGKAPGHFGLCRTPMISVTCSCLPPPLPLFLVPLVLLLLLFLFFFFP